MAKGNFIGVDYTKQIRIDLVPQKDQRFLNHTMLVLVIIGQKTDAPFLPLAIRQGDICYKDMKSKRLNQDFNVNLTKDFYSLHR